MKTLFLFVMCLWSVQLSFAQNENDSTSVTSPEIRHKAELSLSKLNLVIKLSKEQSDQIFPLLVQKEEIRNKFRNSIQNEVARQSLSQKMEAVSVEIDSFLTLEQRNLLEKQKADRIEQRKKLLKKKNTANEPVN